MERRAHPRIKRPFEGHWGASGAKHGRIADLSIGGCFVETFALPPRGEITTVTITWEGGKLSLPGEVVNLEAGMGFGVKFVNLSPEMVAALEEVIASALSSSDKT